MFRCFDNYCPINVRSFKQGLFLCVFVLIYRPLKLSHLAVMVACSTSALLNSFRLYLAAQMWYPGFNLTSLTNCKHKLTSVYKHILYTCALTFIRTDTESNTEKKKMVSVF